MAEKTTKKTAKKAAAKQPAKKPATKKAATKKAAQSPEPQPTTEEVSQVGPYQPYAISGLELTPVGQQTTVHLVILVDGAEDAVDSVESAIHEVNDTGIRQLVWGVEDPENKRVLYVQGGLIIDESPTE